MDRPPPAAAPSHHRASSALADPRREGAAAAPSFWRYPRWNFSRHAAHFRAADAFVVSVQKSGRTWVRVFLTAYFSECPRAGAAATPRLVYTHDLWEHRAKQHAGERLRGKWLIPRAAARAKPILLVARDPRDVMVSLYFHLRKRAGTFHGDLPTLLRDPALGVGRVVDVMNRWRQEWADHPRLHVLRYEDARRDPATFFAGALRFLVPGVEPDAGALARAIEIASFENMRRLETGDAAAAGAALVGKLNQEVLRPKDASDPESFKTRRGKVGGYADYLSPADLAYVRPHLARLDWRYGYGSDEAVGG